MITCNHCGKANPTEALSCQKCGAPLSNNIRNDYVSDARATSQDQPELPAWLESLRVGERPAAPPTSPTNFSASDLVDSNTLPSWMRPGQGAANDNTAQSSGPQAAMRPSGFSAPNTDEGFPSAKGFSANSLVDENSLPTWMQQGQPSTTPQSNISASSLIQPDSMPEWMKSMQPQGPAANPAAAQSVRPPVAHSQPPLPSHGFSAKELIDDKALPDWMFNQNQQGLGQVPPAPGVPGAPMQQGFSANSLLDMDAMPYWMQESEQTQRAKPAPPQPQPFGQSNQNWQPPAQSNATWQPPAQTPSIGSQPANNAFGQSESMSASSFIDMNALPEWLRNAGAQGIDPRQQAAGPQGGQRSGGYGVPPRVENVRVPSRPRAEVNPVEGSEQAANVFASMLGVASNAPHYPPQPAGTNQRQQSGQMPTPQGMSSMSGSMPASAPNTPQRYPGSQPQQSQGYPGPQQSPQGYPGSQPQQPQSYMGVQQPQGYPGPSQSQGYMGVQQPQQGYTQGGSGGYNNVGYQGNQMNYPMNAPQMGGSPNMGATPGGSADPKMNAKPAKRGLFDAIRNLFFR